MDLDTLIDRYEWLTGSLYPSCVLFMLSTIMTFLCKPSSVPNPHDILAEPLAPFLYWGIAAFWMFTGFVFLSYLIRKLIISS